MYIASYYKENNAGAYKAEIHNISEGYRIDYYSPAGFLKSVVLEDKNISYASDVAKKWIDSIETLNG